MELEEPDINRALKILADPTQKNRSIIDVAFDAGYYRLRTFNKVFRRTTNMCPSEYRAYHLKFKEVTGMTPAEYEDQHD